MCHFKHLQIHPVVRNCLPTDLSSYAAEYFMVNGLTAKLDLLIFILPACILLSLTSTLSATVTSLRTFKAYKSNDKVAATLGGDGKNLS